MPAGDDPDVLLRVDGVTVVVEPRTGRRGSSTEPARMKWRARPGTLPSTVLGGELVVPCTPNPRRGAEFPSEARAAARYDSYEASRVGSCATRSCEPSQVRKEAALSGPSRVPQGCLARVEYEHDLVAPLSTAGARSFTTSVASRRGAAGGVGDVGRIRARVRRRGDVIQFQTAFTAVRASSPGSSASPIPRRAHREAAPRHRDAYVPAS